MVADVAVKEPGRQAIWMKLVDATESRKRAFVLSTAATALTLVGSFLNFLNYNAYPVTSAEALLVLGGMLAVSVFVGLLGAGLGVFGQMVIPTLLVVVAVQVNFQAAILPLYARGAGVARSLLPPGADHLVRRRHRLSAMDCDDRCGGPAARRQQRRGSRIGSGREARHRCRAPYPGRAYRLGGDSRFRAGRAGTARTASHVLPRARLPHHGGRL